jgi:hypothetical protein
MEDLPEACLVGAPFSDPSNQTKNLILEKSKRDFRRRKSLFASIWINLNLARHYPVATGSEA